MTTTPRLEGDGGGGDSTGTGTGTGTAILVDVVEQQRSGTSNSVPKSGRCTHRNVEAFRSIPGVQIINLPSLDDWKYLLETTTTTTTSSRNNNPKQVNFDVIIVDLGHLIGNDLYLSTLSLTNEILSIVSAAPPRVILVKSKSLACLSRRMIPAQQLLQGHVSPIIEQPDNHNHTNRARGERRSTSTSTSSSSSEPYILCAVGVEEYRRLIPHIVQSGDVVIEVGCHFGRTTTLLDQAAKKKMMKNNNNNNMTVATDNSNDGSGGYCIGVDIGPKIIQNAMSQYPSLQFAVADARKTLGLLKLRNDIDGILGYDLVFADIGGLSGAHGTLEALTLLESLSNALGPRCIVIKSLCMKRLASRLRSFTQIWAKNRQVIEGDAKRSY